MRFAIRVAVVTGASRGVGKVLALRLAAEGCDVVVAAKTAVAESEAAGHHHETAREIEALGRRALAVQLDVRDDAAVEGDGQAGARSLRPRRLPGQQRRARCTGGRLAETEMKRFDLVMGVNARGAFACTRHVLPAMIAQKFGHILMLSPPVDVNAATGKVAYAISKFGMTLIAHGVADEVREHNVAANALWPATLLESQATIRWGLGDRSMWRKPEIVADAMVALFAKEPRSLHGAGADRRGLLAGRRA